jgi:hypothetical protein
MSRIDPMVRHLKALMLKLDFEKVAPVSSSSKWRNDFWSTSRFVDQAPPFGQR